MLRSRNPRHWRRARFFANVRGSRPVVLRIQTGRLFASGKLELETPGGPHAA